MRYRYKLTCYTTGEKNRVQNSLTTSNIQLATAFSDVFGKSASAILDHMLHNPDDKDFDVSQYIHKNCKTPIEEIKLSIDGAVSHEQAKKLKIIRSHMDNLASCKESLETTIANLAKPLLPQINLVSTAPGIKDFSAIGIISEIGVDMSAFPTAKHLCSWAGVAPQCNESGGKKKSSRISRAGVYIKPLLVQCANAAVKSNKHPEIKNRYQAIKKRRGHKRAIIAIARMLLTAIYNILKKNEPYNAELYRISDMPSISREQQAILLLQKRGYSITKDDLIA